MDDLGYFQTDCRQQKSFFEHEGPLLPKMAGFSFGIQTKNISNVEGGDEREDSTSVK
jgi:hypothetical protein